MNVIFEFDFLTACLYNSKATKIAYKPLTTGTMNRKSKQETIGMVLFILTLLHTLNLTVFLLLSCVMLCPRYLEQSKIQLAAKSRKVAVSKTVHSGEH